MTTDELRKHDAEVEAQAQITALNKAIEIVRHNGPDWPATNEDLRETIQAIAAKAKEAEEKAR